MKRYAMQVDEHTTRIFLGVPRDVVTVDLDGELVHDKWPPEGAIEIDRRPEKDEILRVIEGKAVYTKRSVKIDPPSLEERVEALEAKQLEIEK